MEVVIPANSTSSSAINSHYLVQCLLEAVWGCLLSRTSDLRRGERVASTSGRGSHALEQTAPRGESSPSTFRPWQFDLPTLEEMSHEDWPDKVRDWELFWTRHAVWQNYIQYRTRRNAKPRPQHEEWWGLHDTASVTEVRETLLQITPVGRKEMHNATAGNSRVISVHITGAVLTGMLRIRMEDVNFLRLHGGLSQALKAVSDRVPDILAMGVPIPEHISFDTFNVFSDRREMDIYGKKKINHFSLDMDVRKKLNPEVEEESDQDAPAPWEVTSYPFTGP